ncbi:MAG: MOSC domain-containing protein [Xanthomonadales bacterium]|nr:MOSC domain-containing protein [Xanthomonadales bacterium]MCB1613919.1 MOSC domain-containing protein [Xanthomonadales bacterium]
MNGSVQAEAVGQVIGLWRYPVKSMAGEALDKVDVSWHGLTGDRRWAFVRDLAAPSGFPWLTLRERADMSHYQPTFVDPDLPDHSPVRVRTPTGTELGITDPALASELHPATVRVIKQDRGVFDTFPVSIITTQTIRRLATLTGAELDVRRFRPNILVEATVAGDFPEDQWVGRILRVGSLRLRVDKRDVRCVVITIDPTTTERNTTILRTVISDRQGCLGVYASTVEPGLVTLNDAVFVEPA